MSILQKGMVVWIGKDPRGGYFYLTYNPFKEGRGICFADSVPYLQRLGLKITVHWKETLRNLGFYGVYHCDFHALSPADHAAGWVKLSPVVEKLFADGLTNKAFTSLLRKDEDFMEGNGSNITMR